MGHGMTFHTTQTLADAIAALDAAIEVVESLDREQGPLKVEGAGLKFQEAYGKLLTEVGQLDGSIASLKAQLHDVGRRMVRLCAMRD